MLSYVPDITALHPVAALAAGLILLGIAILVGPDLGVALLAGRVNHLNTFLPPGKTRFFWNALGAGIVIAAWPIGYGLFPSGFYVAVVMAVLGGCMVRPLMEWRYQNNFSSVPACPACQIRVKKGLFWIGALSSFMLGVALGNAVQGSNAVFYVADNPGDPSRIFYVGWEAFNAWTIFCGFVSMALIVFQAGVFLAGKTEGLLQRHIKKFVYGAGGLFIILLLAEGAGIWLWLSLKYNNFLLHQLASPLGGVVFLAGVGWSFGIKNGILSSPYWLLILPGSLGFSALLSMVLIKLNAWRYALLCSRTSIATIILLVGLSLYIPLLIH